MENTQIKFMMYQKSMKEIIPIQLMKMNLKKIKMQMQRAVKSSGMN